MKHCKNLMLLGIMVFGTEMVAVPARVIMSRHAEKTAKPREVYFEQWHLKSSQPLDYRGWQRAFALAPKLAFGPYGDIVAIFAPTPDSGVEGGESVRPVQTATPLSNLLNMSIRTDFLVNAFDSLVDHIKTQPAYHGKTVYICWEHEHIPPLAKAFKVKGAPTTWDKKVFDRFWILDFDLTSGEVIKFKNKSQELLFGDSKK